MPHVANSSLHAGMRRTRGSCGLVQDGQAAHDEACAALWPQKHCSGSSQAPQVGRCGSQPHGPNSSSTHSTQCVRTAAHIQKHVA